MVVLQAVGVGGASASGTLSAPLIRLRDPIRKNVACKCRTDGPQTARPRSQSQPAIQKPKKQTLTMYNSNSSKHHSRQEADSWNPPQER